MHAISIVVPRCCTKLVVCTGADSRNFLEWLKETVNEAIVAAEQHEQLKRSIRELRASIEDRFLLSAIHVRAHVFLHVVGVG